MFSNPAHGPTRRNGAPPTVVDSTEKGEVAIVKRLNADAQPVDAESAESPQRVWGHGAGVRLERDFGAGCDSVGRLETGENSFELSRREERRGAAAEEDRLARRRAELIPSENDLAGQRRKEVFNRLGTCHRIEVAVETLALAEGNVNVERSQRAPFSASRDHTLVTRTGELPQQDSENPVFAQAAQKGQDARRSAMGRSHRVRRSERPSRRGTRPEDGSPQMGLFQQPTTGAPASRAFPPRRPARSPPCRCPGAGDSRRNFRRRAGRAATAGRITGRGPGPPWAFARSAA